MELINGMKPSEWLKKHETGLRVELFSIEGLSWSNPDVFFRVCLYKDGRIEREIKFHNFKWKESPDILVVLAETHKEVDLLEDYIAENLDTSQKVYDYFANASSGTLLAKWEEEHGHDLPDRFEIIKWFKTHGIYKVLKSYMEEKELMKIDFDRIIERIIGKLKEMEQ